MGLKCRVFFVDAAGVRPIPLRRFERLYLLNDSSERFPEYAGQRLRFALIAVEVKERKPVAIRHASYSIIQLDAEGRVDASEWRRGARLGMDMVSWFRPEARGGPVLDARGRFAKKRYEHEFKWRPSREIEGAIAQAIFGGGEDSGGGIGAGKELGRLTLVRRKTPAAKKTSKKTS